MTRSDSPMLSMADASPQVIVFDGPCASWMIVTWQASMFVPFGSATPRYDQAEAAGLRQGVGRS